MREPTRRAESPAARWLMIFLALGTWSAAQAWAEAAPEPAAGVEVAEVADRASDAEPQAAAFWGGLWIFVDPVTGELSPRPTAAQEAWRRSQPSAGLLNKSSDGLVPFALDGGGRGVHLKGRFRHSLIVTVADDGTFDTVCTDHANHGDHASHGDGEHPHAVVEATAEAPVR